jgi:hypothetical protein
MVDFANAEVGAVTDVKRTGPSQYENHPILPVLTSSYESRDDESQGNGVRRYRVKDSEVDDTVKVIRNAAEFLGLGVNVRTRPLNADPSNPDAGRELQDGEPVTLISFNAKNRKAKLTPEQREERKREADEKRQRREQERARKAAEKSAAEEAKKNEPPKRRGRRPASA